MKRRSLSFAAGALLFALLLPWLSACGTDGGITTVVQPPPECDIARQPRKYAVYFALDVSGSMHRFLETLGDSAADLARSFPKEDGDGRQVMVDFYVVAFVNNVAWFPGPSPMNLPMDVKDAIQQAIQAAEGEHNLNASSLNLERAENSLDALSAIVEAKRRPDTKSVVILATDAGFVEAPNTLSGPFEVKARLADVREGLERIQADVHVFTPAPIDGITRNFGTQPGLNAVPGVKHHDIPANASAKGLIGVMKSIGFDASCVPPPPKTEPAPLVEAGAAAAGVGRPRVVELKARSRHAHHIIDGRAFEQHRRDRVHVDFDALDAHLKVARLGLLVKIQAILVARAAAAVHKDAQRLLDIGAFGLHGLFDHLDGFFAQRDRRLLILLKHQVAKGFGVHMRLGHPRSLAGLNQPLKAESFFAASGSQGLSIYD